MFERNTAAGFSISKVFSPLVVNLPNIKLLRVPTHRSLLWSVIRNIIYIYEHRSKVGINHINGEIHYGVIGLIGCKSIVTVHDLCMVDLNKGLKRWIKGLFWFVIPSKIVGRITCISEFTKKRFCEYTGYPKDKVSVIYNPVAPMFVFTPKIFNEKRPVILHIGTRPNKNLERVIEALSEMECHLRIIGEISEDIMESLARENIDYSVSKNLNDEEIVEEYKKCDIVSFPSLYEGFGMPIIEGQAVGRCVVTSKLGPMPEIAGGAAILVNPYSVESIRSGFLQIIKNKTLRDEMIIRGRRNVDRFSLENITSQYVALYENYIS